MRNNDMPYQNCLANEGKPSNENTSGNPSGQIGVGSAPCRSVRARTVSTDIEPSR